MEIITEGWPDENQVLLDEVTCTYIQDDDCTEKTENECQSIEFSTRDGGGGKFIHFKTSGWSFIDEKDLLPLINDFKQRGGLK